MNNNRYFIFSNLISSEMRKILSSDLVEANEILKRWCKNMGYEFKNWVFVGESEIDS